MKKILNLMTISTLTTIIPNPLFSNISFIEKVKQDVGMSNSNNEYVPLREISGFGKAVQEAVVDSKDNIYFCIEGISDLNNGLYKLSAGSNTPMKINNSSSVISIAIDSKDDIYFGKSDFLFPPNNGLYKLSAGSNTPMKIDGINDVVASIFIDKFDNVYTGTNKGAYKLSAGSNTPIKINGVDSTEYSMAMDSKNNFYFIKPSLNGVYVLKNGSNTPMKIDGISNSVKKIEIDSKNNVYFGVDDIYSESNNGLYKLSAGSNTPMKIDGINDVVASIFIDKFDNVYTGTNKGAYKLSAGSNTPIKINGVDNRILSTVIDNSNNLYFAKINGLYILQTALSWTKEQSQFNLIDSTKKKTWTRNDLLTVDGELNIEIQNNNIDKVLFDNVQQTTTNKKWNINVKPETSEKDHHLEVIFTLDGKQYTSKIIVSMQAKIDPPTPPIQENLSDVIKFGSDNNLGNILDNNNETIISAIIQKNSRIIDFSQIEIEKKDIHSATLTAKKDSKSYQGSVVVKYNIVPATVVDLQIDLKPTSPSTQVDIDYVVQIDKTIITNPVNSFYYANSESKITMIKPTASSVINGKVYGCDEQWTKSSTPPKMIDPTNGIVLDGSQLSTNNGKYIIELQDNLGNHNNIYLQIAPKQEIAHYFDTDNGKQFEKWAKANGHDNIRGYSVRQLNKLFEESKSWIQQANDNQLANAVADWLKTKGTLASKQAISQEQIIEQLKQQIPKIITIDKFDTSNYNLNKVSFEIKGMQFQPNEKVEIIIKYGSEKSNSFTLQIKNSNPPNNNTKGLTVWAVVGIVIGVLSGLLLLGWLLKKFVITPFISEPMRKKKSEAFQRQTEKDIAQMKADEVEEETKRKGEK